MHWNLGSFETAWGSPPVRKPPWASDLEACLQGFVSFWYAFLHTVPPHCNCWCPCLAFSREWKPLKAGAKQRAWCTVQSQQVPSEWMMNKQQREGLREVIYYFITTSPVEALAVSSRLGAEFIITAHSGSSHWICERIISCACTPTYEHIHLRMN